MRRPVLSAKAPRIGAQSAIRMPDTVWPSDQRLCARASATCSVSPLAMKLSVATAAK
jgi:hypothetical protein